MPVASMHVALALVAAFMSPAAAQEAEYSPYVESVQMMLDADTGEARVSVLLQSVSVDDIMLPISTERALQNHDRILAALFTNIDTCVLGVIDEACIIINMERIPGETDIGTVQRDARAVGDAFIDELNAALGTDAEFHSVFVHHDDTQNRALGISGAVVGYNTVSAVYTVPQRDTASFYDMLASKLLADGIYEGGGFLDAGRALALQNGSTVTFAAVPGITDTLMQLRVSKLYSHTGDAVNPLEHTGAVSGSAHFGDGFYPLNSLIRVVVFSQNGTAVSEVQSPHLPTTQAGGRTVPSDLTREGWFFDPGSGTVIRGTYLMGTAGSAHVGQTQIALGEAAPDAAGAPNAPVSRESALVVGLIVAAGAGAAAFYLRGYRKR